MCKYVIVDSILVVGRENVSERRPSEWRRRRQCFDIVELFMCVRIMYTYWVQIKLAMQTKEKKIKYTVWKWMTIVRVLIRPSTERVLLFRAVNVFKNFDHIEFYYNFNRTRKNCTIRMTLISKFFFHYEASNPLKFLCTFLCKPCGLMMVVTSR